MAKSGRNARKGEQDDPLRNLLITKVGRGSAAPVRGSTHVPHGALQDFLREATSLRLITGAVTPIWTAGQTTVDAVLAQIST